MLVGSSLCRSESDGTVVVSAPIETRDSVFDLYYKLPAVSSAVGADTFLIAALLPAMKLAEPLQVEGSVSQKLLRALPTIQGIFHAWDPTLKQVEVQPARVIKHEPASGRGVACFFSGGADSFYSILKHRNEIDALVFVHGFDVALANGDIRKEVSRSLGNAAKELGKPLIEVETNIRDWLDPVLSWEFAHGAAAASVALALTSLFERIYLAATFAYSQLMPWGSHPLIDPLWSTEEMELVHDGAEITRGNKLLKIASSETALRYLRVCLENHGGVTNCGRCGKCVRTLIPLEVAGASERCRTFAEPFSLDVVASLDLSDPISYKSMQDSFRVVRANSTDAGLLEAIETAFARAGNPVANENKGKGSSREQLLESTQVWAKELEAAVLEKDRELQRVYQFLPVRIYRTLARTWRKPGSLGKSKTLSKPPAK